MAWANQSLLLLLDDTSTLANVADYPMTQLLPAIEQLEQQALSAPAHPYRKWAMTFPMTSCGRWFTSNYRLPVGS